MKYHLLSGNEAEAARLLDKLLAPNGKVGYIQFRYLRGRSKDEIFRSIREKAQPEEDATEEPTGA